MSKGEIVKLEIYNWRKISHGLFDYHNKDCHMTNLKVEQTSQVFMRIWNNVQAFDNFQSAKICKEEHSPLSKSKEGDKCTFLFCTLKNDNSLTLYSYNQLEVILNYFDNQTPLVDVDLKLYGIFQGWETVSDAKEQLEYLGAELFSKDLWRVAKTLDWRKHNKNYRVESKGVEIHEGNIIKMGRLKMRLMKIKLAESEVHQVIVNKKSNYAPKFVSEEEAPVDIKDISYVMSDQSEEIPPWRFWLSNVMEDQNNPLINPCFCKGTQGLLHLECLKSWMGSKRTHRVFSDYSEMYTWKTMHWELCKEPYPFKIWFGGKQVSLLEHNEPDEPFLIFETFLKEGSDKATSKSLYILRLKHHGNFRIGRSHDVEFHIEDISVSRFHGELQITKDKVFMQDYKSKYGTQILIKGAQVLDKKDQTMNMFQVGRTWFMASYIQK